VAASAGCNDRVMAVRLLEREAELELLENAVETAGAGSGSVVLLSGEAGIGKTSVVRALIRNVAGRGRVITGACEDMLAPRVLGPLRDATRARPGGPLADALAVNDRDAVLTAVCEELSGRPSPTVLVVEDAHWADEATLDVLRYVGRRIADLPAVLLITYRDDEIGVAHPLQRVLGGLSGESVHRLVLRQLSRAAVTSWAGGTNATSAALYRLTGGNPFFVSEVLAASGGAWSSDGVPPTVVDAVVGRVRQLTPRTQAALEQLAVVPSRVDLPLARALLGDLTELGEAERFGLLEVTPGAVGFRHELARRAVEGSLPSSVRMQLNAQVLAALLADPEMDLARIVHHGVEAGDQAAVVEYGPRAARRAVAAGAQRQGATLYGQVLRHRELLGPEEEASLSEAYAWTLFNSNRREDAVRIAEEAVRLREGRGDDAALGQSLAFLSLHQWMHLQPAAALASSRRAVRLLEVQGDSAQRVSALVYLGVLLVNVDRERDGLEPIGAALAMAERIGADRLVPVGLIYRGRARALLGDRSGLAELLSGLELARSREDHENVMLGYLNAVAVLWRLGRYEELVRYLDEGAEYGRDRDFTTLDRSREAFRCRLLALRGEWDAAESGLREILDGTDDSGTLGRLALPTLARLAVRRGREDAESNLAAARANAERAQSLQGLVLTAVAELEHAWLTGRAGAVRAAALEILPRTVQVGLERERGELARYLRRLGEPMDAFAGCPEEFAAGLRGDWRGAAARWERIGGPYERALELAESGEVEPTSEAVEVFDGLGARPAAAWTRRRLREMGVSAIPRGPRPATRSNPAGLTDRQVEILGLLATGLTNAEIAARLVVSVRTVDHHVSAVLQKLGASSRKEATAAAVRFGVK
jgi:DNA-binding CsgD family transcriptional regulator/tetratricopeptide (TPR) repeat protein